MADPVKEAVERARKAWTKRNGCPLDSRDCYAVCVCRLDANLAVTAALAPYGGLEKAIKKLEEVR